MGHATMYGEGNCQIAHVYWQSCAKTFELSPVPLRVTSAEAHPEAKKHNYHVPSAGFPTQHVT
jgi:hypothetical protein